MLTHPDLNADAPPAIKNANEKALMRLNSLLDVIEDSNQRLEPQYPFIFHVRRKEASAREWIEASVTLSFPAAAQGTERDTIVDGQLKVLLAAAGIGPKPTPDDTEGAVNTPKSRVGGLMASRAAPAANQRAAKESSNAAAASSLIRSLQRQESNVSSIQEICNFLYGEPTRVRGRIRPPGPGFDLGSDEAEAALFVSVLFRSGRVLIERGLAPTISTNLMKKLGIALIAYHRGFQLDHPVGATLCHLLNA